jgi:hypothetical protein
MNFINIIVFLIMLAGLAYTYKYEQLEYRIRQKIKQSAGTSVDERVALRSATTQMITADGKRGQIWYGWGRSLTVWYSFSYVLLEGGLMNLTISGHHLDVTSALREYVLTKLDRVTRHFRPGRGRRRPADRGER